MARSFKWHLFHHTGQTIHNSEEEIYYLKKTIHILKNNPPEKIILFLEIAFACLGMALLFIYTKTYRTTIPKYS